MNVRLVVFAGAVVLCGVSASVSAQPVAKESAFINDLARKIETGAK